MDGAEVSAGVFRDQTNNDFPEFSMMKPLLIAASVLLPLCVFAGGSPSHEGSRGGSTASVQSGGSHGGRPSVNVAHGGSRTGDANGPGHLTFDGRVGSDKRDPDAGSFESAGRDQEPRSRGHGDDFDLGAGPIHCDPSDPVVPPTSPIPEPETAALMLAGLGALVIAGRRRL